MKLQTRLAVLVCKASGAVLRKLGRGGTNLPGKLALKIDKNILGELCISDDPDYVTGYFASKELGYVRITKLKEPGSPNGGRIFLFRGSEEEARACIRYLEREKVLVHLPEEAGQ